VKLRNNRGWGQVGGQRLESGRRMGLRQAKMGNRIKVAFKIFEFKISLPIVITQRWRKEILGKETGSAPAITFCTPNYMPVKTI
jgi:hypothetical protein